MRQLTLTIRDHGSSTDYTYGPDRLLVEVGSVDASVRDLDIELEDIPIELGPDSNGDPELIGITDPTALPEDTYRAKLEDGSGTILMDGAIVTTDAVYDDKENVWRLRLIDQAAQDFWNTLESRYFDGAGGQLVTQSFSIYQDRGDELTSSQTELEQIRSVLEQILTEINATYDMPTHLWEYDIEYADSTVYSYDSSEVYISRGDVDDKTLVEEITTLSGWRVKVSYQSFPSLDVHVEMRPTSWPAPAAAVVLDGEEEAESYEVKMEDNADNWALGLGNGVDSTSPDPRSRSYSNGDVRVFAYPPAFGAIAPEVWSAAPPGSALNVQASWLPSSVEVGEREMFIDEVSTQFEAPPLSPEEKTLEQSATERKVHGRILLQNTESLPLFKQETGEKLFIVERGKQDPDKQSGVYYAVVSQHPPGEKYDATKDIAHSAHWALAPYQQQPMRRTTVREAEGTWIDVGQQPVGDPDTVLELLSTKWQVHEARRDLDAKMSELLLRHPVQVTTKPDRPDRPATDSDWTVIKPRAEYATFDRGSGNEDWVFVHWEPTPTQEAEEVHYHVEIKDNRDSSPSWDRFAQADLIDDTYATAAAWQEETAGNGGKNITDGDLEIRIRPVRGPSDVGGWRTIDVIQN